MFLNHSKPFGNSLAVQWLGPSTFTVPSCPTKGRDSINTRQVNGHVLVWVPLMQGHFPSKHRGMVSLGHKPQESPWQL